MIIFYHIIYTLSLTEAITVNGAILKSPTTTQLISM